jgi:hypothetical protein
MKILKAFSSGENVYRTVPSVLGMHVMKGINVLKINIVGD